MNWWRIDPRTGTALGMNSRGWGVSMTEYGLVVSYTFLACLVGASVVHAPMRKAGAICAIVALGSALTLSATLTYAILAGYTLVGGAAGAAIS